MSKTTKLILPDSLLQEVCINFVLKSVLLILLLRRKKVHFPAKDSCNFQSSFQPLPVDLFYRSIVIAIIPCPLSPPSSFSPTPTSFLSKLKSSQLGLASAELSVTMDTLPNYGTNLVSMISYIYFTLTINLKRWDFNCSLFFFPVTSAGIPTTTTTPIFKRFFLLLNVVRQYSNNVSVPYFSLGFAVTGETLPWREGVSTSVVGQLPFCNFFSNFSIVTFLTLLDI